MTDPQDPGGIPPQFQPPQAQPPQYSPQPPAPGPGQMPPAGYPQGVGGPPPGYGAAPPPKKKRTGLIIGLAVGIPLVLIALVVGAILLLVSAASGPADATNAFLKALKDHDTAGLKAVSCQDLSTSGELDSLEATLEGLETTRGTIQSYNINSSSFENDRGNASGTVTFSKGQTVDVDAIVVKEGGAWVVCSIEES